ncbi:MAG: hypothetical protein P1P89_16710, partial [Desulfobacterales bacterium]|nr:hypothetical protein [Desulfobacterales bacterium]
MKPVEGPWGGSNVFVLQLSDFLKRRGYTVVYDLDHDLDVIILVDPRTDNEYKIFGPEQITGFKKRNPNVRVLHRINECDRRKNTAFMDSML